jgi:hypothetical protein
MLAELSNVHLPAAEIAKRAQSIVIEAQRRSAATQFGCRRAVIEKRIERMKDPRLDVHQAHCLGPDLGGLSGFERARARNRKAGREPDGKQRKDVRMTRDQAHMTIPSAGKITALQRYWTARKR